MNPVISIIVPVYNVEKYLPQCVDSVLSQTYKDFELILVDDGSPDGSPAICDSYAQKDVRIRVIHQKNAGVSVARNNGILHARGKWINFIDSDDFVENDYLERFELDKDDADLIIQGIDFFDHRIGTTFKSIKYANVTLEDENLQSQVARWNVLLNGYPYAKAIKKNLLLKNNIRFDKSISFHEDHILILQLLAVSNRIRLSDCTSYKYRCYHTNISLSSRTHAWENMNRAGDEMLKHFIAMKERFYVEGSDYEKSILTFAYNCKMTAAASIIHSDDSYSVKRDHFFQVINSSQIANCYFPKSTRSKLTKFIYQHLPFVCAYLFHKTINLLKKIK